MGWKQVVAFNPAKMGTTPGYCLQNVRLGFGLKAKYASAKDDMLANKKAGTLHSISSLPKNVAVPVYIDTSSVYEHIIASDKGVFYSDGKRLSSLNGMRVFGWGEMCEGVRVVKYVEDPKPAKKSNDEIATEVMQGKWGNGEDRKKRLTAAGYNYDVIQGIVNQKLYGSTPTLKVGDKVVPKRWVDVYGTPLLKTRPYYYISQFIGDRAVLRADNPTTGTIYAAVATSNLTKV